MKPRWKLLGARAAFAVMVMWSAVACSDSGESGSGVRIDTLPNGATRVTNPAAIERFWAATEDLRLGRLEEVSPETFGGIGGLAVDDSGTIYVLERQAREVRAFAADGAHRWTVGRQGEGPGEFQAPIGLAHSPDGLIWVVDARNARYSAYDSQGRLVREERRPTIMLSAPWPGRFGADGSFYDSGGSKTVIRLMPDFTVRDTVVLPAVDLDQVDVARADGAMHSRVTVPFSSRPLWRVDGEGAFWIADGRNYEVTRITADGDTSLLVLRDLPAIDIPASVRDSAVDAAIRLGMSGGGALLQRNVVAPRTYPVLRDLIIDTDGRLWALRFPIGDEPSSFDVFERDGRYLATVRLPEAVQLNPAPIITSGHIHAVVLDALDVPHVVRFRFDKR